MSRRANVIERRQGDGARVGLMVVSDDESMFDGGDDHCRLFGVAVAGESFLRRRRRDLDAPHVFHVRDHFENRREALQEPEV